MMKQSWYLPCGALVVVLIAALFPISSTYGKAFLPDLKPFLTTTGLGAVVLTLATQQLAKELVGGLHCRLQRTFKVGDEVLLGDGTTGIVHSIGWTCSSIQGYDDLLMNIPNTQLVNQRVINLTSAKRSEVKQVLRFKYSDLPKIPKLLEDIKDSVKTACPKVITDGSAIFRGTCHEIGFCIALNPTCLPVVHPRPFTHLHTMYSWQTAYITSYEPDHVQVVVDFHFEIPACSEEACQSKQACLLTISKTLANHRVELALPARVSYRTE